MKVLGLLTVVVFSWANRIQLHADTGTAPCWDATGYTKESLKVWNCGSHLPERQVGWATPSNNGQPGEISFKFPNVDTPWCVSTRQGKGQPLMLEVCDSSSFQQFYNRSGSTNQSHHYLQQDCDSGTMCVQSTSPNPSNGDPIILGECSTVPHQPIEQQQRWNSVYDVQPDVRVAKAVGSRGQSAVRFSVITAASDANFSARHNATARFNSKSSDKSFDFDYSAQFKYKWTHNWLQTSLKADAQPGTNYWTLGMSTLQINLPSPGAGVRGVMVGDPCILPNEFFGCAAQSSKGVWDVQHTLPRLLNLMQSSPSKAVNFIALLGDNFYDRSGKSSADFYSRLETPVKTTLLVTVPGNHDYWLIGSPSKDLGDQYGNGFMQFYGQDVMAASASSPYDFSVDPVTSQLPDPSNFFSYYTIGNVGVIGYSDAYDWSSYSSSFQEACGYFGQEKPAHVLVLAHWSGPDHGCASGMDAPSVLIKVRAIPGCKSALTVFGHQHCNRRDGNGHCQNGTGGVSCFLLGAGGMPDSACDAHYGFLYLDSTGPSLKLLHFRLGDQSSDLSGPLLGCLATKGIAECEQFAQEVWLTGSVGTNTTGYM